MPLGPHATPPLGSANEIAIGEPGVGNEPDPGEADDRPEDDWQEFETHAGWHL
jgi:hypothetical protein